MAIGTAALGGSGLAPQGSRRVLLTGATGYVGGRLLGALQAAGVRVRCLARHPEHLAHRVSPTTEVVSGDIQDRARLTEALDGVDSAFYLVHSMGSGHDFEAEERAGALCFAEVARERGVKRIIYLGALAREGSDLSPHLRSRHEVGRILASTGVPTLEFRASIVLGSGSLSFEMIRALVDRLPIMVTPRWVRVKAQPIAIRDLIRYLVAGLDFPLTKSRVFEIGGADRVAYGDLMREYARLRGLKRLMIPVPVLSPRLSSLWLGLVTPLYARVGRRLVESIVHETVVEDDAAQREFSIRPVGLKEAMADALDSEAADQAATAWHDAVSSSGSRRLGHVSGRTGNRVWDTRVRDIPVSAERVFEVISRIGGVNGYYAWNGLWKIRGMVDLLLGGVGIRRGRPAAGGLRVGSVVDFWRVEAYEAGRVIRLVAEMKVPGRAWLEFEVKSAPTGCVVRQTALFDPAGLLGVLYWYSLYPLHHLVFEGMLSGIAREAGRAANPLPRAPRPS